MTERRALPAQASQRVNRGFHLARRVLTGGQRDDYYGEPSAVMVFAIQAIGGEGASPPVRKARHQRLSRDRQPVDGVGLRRGVAIFAAAGNESIDVAAASDLKLWPAEYAPRVVEIGATAPCGAAVDGNVLNDYYDNLASYSNFGFDQHESRFLVFPDGDNQCARNLQCQVGALTLPCRFFDQIVTTAPRGTGLNGYTVFMGTSASTPHAAGLAALILSRYPDMKVGTLVDTILNTATDLGEPGYDRLFGYGRGSGSWLG